jgi:hypothetical protein
MILIVVAECEVILISIRDILFCLTVALFMSFLQCKAAFEEIVCAVCALNL